MPQQIISENTRANLEILTRTGILKDFYLAGGTGLALQLKHRFSLDLDFFTPKSIIVKDLIQKLKKIGKLAVEKEAEQTLVCAFKGTRLTFLKYEYPCIFEFKRINGVKVADSKDIGCMKIDAVSSRGTKRDFIDLYFILQKITLGRALNFYDKKYEKLSSNLIHIKKSLVYFQDAEKDPMPKMLFPVSWEKTKDFFRKEVKKLS